MVSTIIILKKIYHDLNKKLITVTNASDDSVFEV